jgi:hypothetical protein
MKRPKTSEYVINEFIKVIDNQDSKGLLKYETTIDEAKDEDYHWLEMAGEEVADLFKYLVKEIVRLRKVIFELRFSQRKSLVDKLMRENLELAEEVERLKIVEQAYAAYRSANA